MNEDGTADDTLKSLTPETEDPFEITIVSSGRNEYYSYDGSGNRTRKDFFTADTTENWAYEYIEGTNLVKFDGEYAYQYDANGNLTAKGTSYNTDKTSVYQLGDYTKYTYDNFNRLIKVQKLNLTGTALETVVEYTYNAMNMRVQRTADSIDTTYHFDPEGKVLEEVTGTEVTDYTYLGSKHLAKITDTQTLYYGTDHLGSTILLTNAAGEDVWSGEITPFGDQESTKGLDEHVKYTGKDWDEEAELFYFNWRWYDPEIGRFTTEDSCP
ncbi:MAG: hypothetical protein JEY99_11920 [Spirochaetales bacterium]|nr:hypothetical protein [Spirochaetales bacterium]